MLTRCGYCDSCRRGMDNICDNNRKAHRDADVVGPAGLAEYVLLEDYQLYPGSNEVSFDFHWADNIQKSDDIIEFSISGDSAPNRRFNYSFDTFRGNYPTIPDRSSRLKVGHK